VTERPPSSSGLGYLVLSQKTGVRFPVGVWIEGRKRRARVAQLVEHFLGKEEATGSSPVASSISRPGQTQVAAGRTDRSGSRGPHRLTVRTPLFQGGDRGSIPRGGVVVVAATSQVGQPTGELGTGLAVKVVCAGIAQFACGDFAGWAAYW
jgi:hypothetical protein